MQPVNDPQPASLGGLPPMNPDIAARTQQITENRMRESMKQVNGAPRNPSLLSDEVKNENLVPNIPGAQAPKVNSKKKIRPNDLCPCGSGQKYKKCHGRP